MRVNVEIFSDEDDCFPLVISGGSFSDFNSLTDLLKDAYDIFMVQLAKRNLTR